MIGITKYGWREVALATLLWIGLSAASCFMHWHWLSIVWTVLWLYVLLFFRDPRRRIPTEAGAFVSPADGKVTDVTELDGFEYIDGPAVRIGIFMNVFSVHVNRSPADGVVDYKRYRAGRKVNAMRADAGQVNESCTLGLRDTAVGRIVVRQIAGLIARRIVCEPRLGDHLTRGQPFGMIKFGSRAELILPRKTGLLIAVKPGDKVRAGRDVLAKFHEVIIAEPVPSAESHAPSAESGTPPAV